MNVELQESADGVVLPVLVRAAARRNAVVGPHLGQLRVDVTTAPEKGKANAAVAKLLARFFGLPKSSVELIAGGKNPRKRFLLQSVSLADIAGRIADVADHIDG